MVQWLIQPEFGKGSGIWKGVNELLGYTLKGNKNNVYVCDFLKHILTHSMLLTVKLFLWGGDPIHTSHATESAPVVCTPF